jgi:hypothetical protein
MTVCIDAKTFKRPSLPAGRSRLFP